MSLKRLSLVREMGLLWIIFVFAVACQSIPDRYPVRAESKSLAEAQQVAIRDELVKHFGSPKSPIVSSLIPPSLGLDSKGVLAGQVLFKTHCAKCHGVLGDGDGRWLDARRGPRDFTRGVFKFTSTGGTPTKLDLERTIRQGIPQTRMNEFSELSDSEISALINYVKFIAIRGVLELRLIALMGEEGELTDELVKEEAALVSKPWESVEETVIVPELEEPAPSQKLLAEGRALFQSDRAKCYDCHGADGKGGGAGGENLKDNWDNDVEPADLTLKDYRGGKRSIDIYYRIAGGIPGTPMPAMRKVLSAKEIWALSQYLKSLE
ncbi:MAG: c-type cytochrome [Planctomycetota bacterium]|nr:c-type cytochrome [Planctomycetota bacterium]